MKGISHTSASSVVGAATTNKTETSRTANNSLRHHPTTLATYPANMTGVPVGTSGGIINTNSHNTIISSNNNGTIPQHLHRHQHLAPYSNDSTTPNHLYSSGGLTLVTDTTVTSATNTPLHHAATTPHKHHGYMVDLSNHPTHSNYNEQQILLEQQRMVQQNYNESPLSSPTSSSASELHASLGGVTQPDSSYQNYLAFRAQQLNAAQIYASPPGTPLSQIYETTGPGFIPDTDDTLHEPQLGGVSHPRVGPSYSHSPPSVRHPPPPYPYSTSSVLQSDVLHNATNNSRFGNNRTSSSTATLQNYHVPLTSTHYQPSQSVPVSPEEEELSTAHPYTSTSQVDTRNSSGRAPKTLPHSGGFKKGVTAKSNKNNRSNGHMNGQHFTGNYR